MSPRKILIIDGQGGRIGRQLAEAVKAACPQDHITVIGTNSMATAAMLRSAPDQAATGENSVIVASRTADIIMGPVGIAMANSLLGEITPAMAAAVSSSPARKILIPMSKCDITIVGTETLSLQNLLDQAVSALAKC